MASVEKPGVRSVIKPSQYPLRSRTMWGLPEGVKARKENDVNRARPARTLLLLPAFGRRRCAVLLRALRGGGRAAGHGLAVERHALHALAEELRLLRADGARIHPDPS